MSCFQSLNINSKIELDPNFMIGQINKSLLKKRNYNKVNQEAKIDGKCFYQNQFKGNNKVLLSDNKTDSSKKERNLLIAQKVGIKQNKAKYKQPSYYQFKKINQNSLKIRSLLLNFTDNLKEKQKFQQSRKIEQTNLFQLQQYIILILNYYKLVPKRQQQTKVIPKKKKPANTDKFQQISKYFLQNIHQLFQNKTEFYELIPKFLWQIKQEKFYLTLNMITKEVLWLSQKYGILFKVKSQITNLLQFILSSDKLQVFEETKQTKHSHENTQQNPTKQKGNNSQISKAIHALYCSSQQNQNVFKSFIQKSFITYFMRQQNTNDSKIKNSTSMSHLQEQKSIFNNYQYHARSQNLSAFVPSYEQRNNFFLDKFTERENIFADDQKLMLLLNLSRDPYLPQSSARDIPHIKTLVQNIFGFGQGQGIRSQMQQNRAQQNEEQQNKIQNKMKIQRDKQQQQIQEELKQWQDLFGQLVLKI